MKTILHLCLVFLAWTLGSAVAGIFIFSYLYVEHGTAIIWLALVALGASIGAIHVVYLSRRKK